MHSYLTENQFFAPISNFSAISKCDILFIEAHENYQKRGFRNRCIIDSAQGPLALSIPLQKGKNERKPIRDVTMSYDTDWKRLHLRSIKSSYGSAPYFDHIYPDLISLYRNPSKFLFDFNINIIEWVIKFIELEIKLELTSFYEVKPSDADLIDGRNKLRPGNYTDINPNLPPYSQVFEEKHGYLANLSILDLIFCTGKASLTYLS